MTEEQDFEITTTAQVERTYRVKATDGESAHRRLRRYLEDPEMARPDLVEVLDDRTTDATPQKVKMDTIKPVSRPRAVEPGKDKEAKAS